jgi:hypothetical protein
MIADARAPFARPGGRGADERRREPGPWTMSPRTEDKDRPIDPMSGNKFARKRPEPVSGFGNSGRAQKPFMPRVSHDPCVLMLPFRFAHAKRMRPLSVGRLDNAFHPARIIIR